MLDSRVDVDDAVAEVQANELYAAKTCVNKVIIVVAGIVLVASVTAWITISGSNVGVQPGSGTKAKLAPALALISGCALLAALMAHRQCVRPTAAKAYSLLPLRGVRRRESAGIWLTEITPGRRDSELNFFGSAFDDKLDFVLKAVQTGDIRDANCAEAVVSVFLSFEAAQDLGEFKLALDHELRELGSSLYSLVFELLGLESRTALLAHISQVQPVAESGVAAGPSSTPRIIVLSDMDDTLVSTFKDQRFPFNTMYPGVRQFYHELIRSGGAQDMPADWNKAKDQVIFVTARPSWLNPWTRNEMRRHGFARSVALTGSSVSFITPAQMLYRKTTQCSQVRALFPECVFYLVGDNGQRDIDLGKELLRLNLVRAVFIHDIFEPLSYGQPRVNDPDSVGRRVPFESENSATADATGSGVPTLPPEPTTAVLPRGGTTWVDRPVGELAAEASDNVRGLDLEAPCIVDLESHAEGAETQPAAAGASLVRQRSTGELDRDLFVSQSVPDGYRNEECNEAGIVLFQSYAGAAVAAHEMGIFSTQALMNVATESAKDFSGIQFSRGWQRIRQREVYLRDIARVSHNLHDHEDTLNFLKTVHDNIDVAPGSQPLPPLLTAAPLSTAS
ncbi:Hypothetical Protein FCC1311_072952 [Hondaea fermentalgiana]|uniref:Phosphatidate phosphatase APP1 catalytic domain-containing protein n=1 Tax=Hondaea fermentalgiana TaxID=2315210 RepID=A0A2R5GT66_9STRA|nr:Hypothetical Protein FCC1311_072952 [Hondaea fermentalgiana]|eukprot:GBG31074.1 Hypothetical Protein FCC1311_072952 [Hondaea fermentalgiana]